MLVAGDIIEKYEIEDLAGTGGTASVYRVRHRQLGTLHALKVLAVTSEEIRDRLILEGRLQASLHHLNVVAVTDVIDVNGDPGLILEYIEGPTLEEALTQFSLTVEDAETMFYGILSGVRHAHSHGLVHRDLKPANVLLSVTDQGFVPKVTDFGLAKVLNPDAGSTGTTRSGMAMGTPHYMAPEQIRDARNVDQRSDIFSLGCMLYELVVGERTFPGDDTLQVYNRVVGGEYVDPADLVHDLPERVAMAIRGCLEVNPSNRIPDADTVFAVLRGHQVWWSPRNPRPDDRPVTEDIPRPGPAIQLAARGKEGATPAPAPPRSGMRADPLSTRTDPIRNGLDTPAEPASRNSNSLGAFAAVAAGLAAVALVLFGFGFLQMVRRPPESPPVAVDGASVGRPAPALPAAVEAAIPAPPRPKTVAEQGPVRSALPRVALERRAAFVPTSAAPVTVKILSDPPTASVRVDGKALTPTPLKVELLPGIHRVEMISGADTRFFEIDVGPSADNKWCFAFPVGKLLAGACPR